jgi:alpha-ketoglutarate-dependent 2,4-dichlorophenoxyacetate dioxygenase
VTEHAIAYSRAKLGFAMSASDQQVLVRTHPASGRKSLYLASHAGRILGKTD